MNHYEVGQYRLRELLPGSHSTFIAESKTSHELVAIKTVIGAFGTAEWSALSEALSRPPQADTGVCLIREFGIRQELIYAVAPLLWGTNLQQAIKAVGQQRALLETENQLSSISWATAQFCQTTAELLVDNPDYLKGHTFSAEEFFVTREGEAVLLDPRWVVLRSLVSQPSNVSLVHSLAYQLPERFKRNATSETKFVFGLSTMFWELCTGYRLFRRTSLVETLHSLSEHTIIPPSSLNPRLPKSVDDLVVGVLTSPHEFSLTDLAVEFIRISQVHPVAGPGVLAQWVDTLAPVKTVFEEGGPSESLSALDALLEEEGVTWNDLEESTTFVEAPPSLMRAVEDLSWLEDEPASEVTLEDLPEERPVETTRATPQAKFAE